MGCWVGFQSSMKHSCICTPNIYFLIDRLLRCWDMYLTKLSYINSILVSSQLRQQHRQALKTWVGWSKPLLVTKDPCFRSWVTNHSPNQMVLAWLDCIDMDNGQTGFCLIRIYTRSKYVAYTHIAYIRIRICWKQACRKWQMTASVNPVLAQSQPVIPGTQGLQKGTYLG